MLIRVTDILVPRELVSVKYVDQQFVESLTYEVQSQCPHCHGISTGSAGIAIHFDYNATADEKELARQIALTHTPEQLHPDRRSQVQKAARKQELIEQLRTSTNPIAQAVVELLDLDK